MLLPLLLLAADPHVLIIGIDGFSAEAVRKAPVPNVRRLMAAGSWTLNARGVMPTVSSPNWASILMGAGPEQHGITSNEWQRDKFEIASVCKSALDPTIFPSMFGQIREGRANKVKLAAIHDWKDFGRLIEKSAADEVRHVLGSPQATDAAIAYWQQQQPNLLFVHLDDVDHAGHHDTWHSEKYFAAVAIIDTLVGKLIDAVDLKKTDVFLVADHGGVGTKHGGLTMVELEVPWISAGPHIPKTGEMKSRPVYSLDTAPTVAALFDVKPNACWTGRDVFARKN
jgi:predicted AlkP superfamily pyrophosphatase or phosphodiesterase